MSMFSYECPDCEKELKGSFGEDITCIDCNKTFETDWDYTNPYAGTFAWWIIGEKVKEDVEK